MEKEQDLVGGQPLPRQHFDGEEIDSSENCHVSCNEFLPGGVLATFRRGRQAMATKNVSHCLMRNNVTDISHGSNNSIVTPVAVLSRHLNNQLNDLFVNPLAARV